MTPEQIAALNPSELASVQAAILASLEEGKLTEAQRTALLATAPTAAQKAALAAATALNADNRPLVLGVAGDLTSAQLAALLGGGGALVGSISGVDIVIVDGETITVTVDGVLEATLTLISDAGGSTARTGAKAASVDIGGGAGDDLNRFAGEVGRALRLIIAADSAPFAVEPAAPAIGYAVTGGGLLLDHGGAMRVVAQGATTLVLATNHGDVTVVNP